VTWKSLLTLGISGGLVPCPDAIAILLVAVAINRILFGMALITAFSIGLALVLIGIGIAMVQGARIISRSIWMDKISIYVPVISAFVVLVLGIGLTLTTLFSGSLSTTVQPSPSISSTNETAPNPKNVPVFDLQQAKLIYLSTDSNFVSQLNVIPLAGGNPKALTQETNTIIGFSISPNYQTILFTTLNNKGETFFWAMNRDGTQKKQILECPQAYCSGPEWFPNGKKLVYERRDYSHDVVLYSIWWLDLENGQSQPVFRDQQFPSFAPKFSFDGNWLSYISPSNNTIQIYNLGNGQNLSLPYMSGMPEIWSPVDHSLLYWDIITQGDQPIRHLKRYNLESGRTIDLGGTKDEDDYMAAWSPDGQWIAISRENTATIKEQIWLIKPDRSQAHVLLDQDKVSYGGDLSWSPDSQYLVYSRISEDKNPGTSEIWMTNIQTGLQNKITTGGNQPAFLP